MGTKQHPVIFQLTSIDVIGWELLLPKDVVPQEVYDYDIALETRLIQESEMIRLKLDIQVKVGEVKWGSLTTLFSFSVGNYKDIIVKNKAGKYQIPEDLQVAIHSMAISTSRGILFSTFRGTALQNAILPVIDPNQFL